MKAIFLISSIVLVSVTSVQALSAASTAQQKNAAAAFDNLADRYFSDYYFKFNPSQGTAAGFHEYDNELENYSYPSLQKQITVLHDFKKLFEKVDAKQLDQRASADRELVLGDINSRLLTLEDIRPWEKNPDLYSSNVTGSIFLIMARTFAPADQRLKSVIAREKQIPAVFEAARKNR